MSAGSSLPAFRYRVINTKLQLCFPPLTMLTVCQSPPSDHSRTLRLQPPHHTLSTSPHHSVSVPTNGPGSPGPLAGQLLPPLLTGPESSSWWGLGLQLPV